jgi:hypothetical protein
MLIVGPPLLIVVLLCCEGLNCGREGATTRKLNTTASSRGPCAHYVAFKLSSLHVYILPSQHVFRLPCLTSAHFRRIASTHRTSTAVNMYEIFMRVSGDRWALVHAPLSASTKPRA